MGALHLGEAREYGSNAEIRCISAIDSGEQRVGKAIHHLGAIVALDE